MVEKKATAKKTSTKAKAKGGNVLDKAKNAPKKYKIIACAAAVVIVAAIVAGIIIKMPISKDKAAEIFADMADKYNTAAVNIKNDVSVLDTDKMRSDAKEMIEILDENIKLAKETKWPEGLAKKEERLNGKKVSDMDLYADDLKAQKEFYQRIVDAGDEEMLSIYAKDMPFNTVNTDEFREKLGLPSIASEKSKYHEYTADEISEKLQETAVEITLGKFNIECKTEYGYTRCDSSMDAAVRNKSNINFTNGGSIDVTAYDQSGNPIDTETIYLGNRLEKGQTAKKKIFDLISNEYRSDFQNKPTFKVTKVEIYNY